ncbi:unnamed protein product, partial [Mycena citricolor]
MDDGTAGLLRYVILPTTRAFPRPPSRLSCAGTRSRETSTLTPSDLLVSHISDSCLPRRSVAHSFMVLLLTARATIALRSVSTLHKSSARQSGHAVCSVDSFDQCSSPRLSEHCHRFPCLQPSQWAWVWARGKGL